MSKDMASPPPGAGPAPQGAEPASPSQAKPLVPDAGNWIDEAVRLHLEKHPPKPPCEHEFSGWRDHADGLGGEQFCQKCGLGAMAHTLSLDWD